MNGFISLTGNK